MAKVIIPAKVFMPDGADHSHPVLMVEEQAGALGEMIADHGIEVTDHGSEPGSNPHAHGSELETDMEDSSDAGEVKPPNKFRTCMAELLSRPNGAERLSQPEARARFKKAAHECSERRAKEAVEN